MKMKMKMNINKEIAYIFNLFTDLQISFYTTFLPTLF